MKHKAFLASEFISNKIPNKWGVHPTEYKVLIEPDEEDEVAGRAKLIIVPDSVRDKMQIAKVKGTLVAAGGNAFEDWKDPIPKVGDKVYFAKYAGIQLKRYVGNKHVLGILCNDKDICAVLDDIETLEG